MIAYLHRDNGYTKYPYIQTLLNLNKGDHVKVVSDYNIVYIHGTKSSGIIELSYIRFITKKAQYMYSVLC